MLFIDSDWPDQGHMLTRIPVDGEEGGGVHQGETTARKKRG